MCTPVHVHCVFVCVHASRLLSTYACMVMYVRVLICVCVHVKYVRMYMHKLVCLFTRVVCTACEGVPYLLICVHKYTQAEYHCPNHSREVDHVTSPSRSPE